MKVGWLADDPGYIGGAELTAKAFREAAPEGVEVVDCPPGNVDPDCDRWVIHNCVSYPAEELPSGAFKYWHDVGPHLSPVQWKFLEDTRPICTSPLQRDRMGLDAELIPPPVPLEPFRKASESAQKRAGAVAIGPWMNPAKNPEGAAEWARGNGGIDFYGSGPFAPAGSVSVSYDDLPKVLARYKTFVHLPIELEPCGRSTIEAWASGCSVVVNRLVGARHWIAEEPDKLESAASDFWSLILAS